MTRFYFFRLIGMIVFCHLCTGTIVSAENRVVESAFCLEMDARECAIRVDSDQVDLSQIVAVEDGIKRLYFWSKIAVDEGESIVHVWSKKGSGDRKAEQVYVSKSGRLQDISAETVNRVYEYLRVRYHADPSTNSVQGVLLPIRKSPGFRIYSKIKVRPGDYTVEICDLDGNVIPGGEAKSIRVLP